MIHHDTSQIQNRIIASHDVRRFVVSMCFHFFSHRKHSGIAEPWGHRFNPSWVHLEKGQPQRSQLVTTRYVPLFFLASKNIWFNSTMDTKIFDGKSRYTGPEVYLGSFGYSYLCLTHAWLCLKMIPSILRQNCEILPGQAGNMFCGYQFLTAVYEYENR